MDAAGIEYYDKSVGDQFIMSKLGGYDYASFDRMKRHLVTMMDALHLFESTGQVFFGTEPLRRNSWKLLTCEVGFATQDFITL